MNFRDFIDVIADAFEAGDPRAEDILLELLGPLSSFYWLLAPERGRPKPQLLLGDGRISFDHLVFPLIRQVYPSIVANEVVSVQPMSLPSGLLFYMDYRYNDDDA